MAVEPVFVDTNVLVYYKLTQAPLHATAQAKIQVLRAAGHTLWLSRQILREYLAALSRPQIATPPLPMPDLINDVRQFENVFIVAEDGQAVTGHLLNLLQAIPCAGKQVYDANIVATMLTHNIPKLLTHNTSDFTRFAGQIQVIPLV